MFTAMPMNPNASVEFRAMTHDVPWNHGVADVAQPTGAGSMSLSRRHFLTTGPAIAFLVLVVR